MKKITLLTLTMLLSIVAFAQKPKATAKHVQTPWQQAMQAQRSGKLTKENFADFLQAAKPAFPAKFQKTAKASQPKMQLPGAKNPLKFVPRKKLDSKFRTVKKSSMRPKRVAADASYTMITEAPEGEEKTYVRSGDYSYVSSGYFYTATQNGRMTIVFNGNDVYMKDPIAGASYGTYVHGNLSPDGTTITVPLGQAIAYSGDYDAYIITAMANLVVDNPNSTTFDTQATEVTYTIDGETITLNGTSVEYVYTSMWTDDGTWTGESEWNTVLTEFVPVPSDAQYTFDEGTIEPWTTIDADGDGNAWFALSIADGASYVGYNGSDGFATSASYDNNSGVLTPDNYLVSPKVKLGGKITFYACAQDAIYPAEHFGVAVSTKGNTDATDFEMVSDEWEMTAVPSLAPSFPNAAPGSFRSSRRAMGNWYKYEVDLSAFAGQEGYVAIRHYNCMDMFRLNIDDVTIEEPGAAPVEGEPQTWYTFRGSYYVYSVYGWQDATDEMPSIEVTVNGSDVTIKGLSYFIRNATVTGTIEGNTITIPSGQLLGTQDEAKDYLVAVCQDEEGNASIGENIVLTLDPEEGLLTSVTLAIAENDSPDQLSMYGYWYQPVWTLRTPAEPVVAPEGLETEEYRFKATAYRDNGDIYDADYSIPVFVGFDGNDVYVQGVCEDVPEGWIKGTMDENGVVTFPTGQKFGSILYYGTPYNFFFAGLPINGDFEDVVMDFDGEKFTQRTPDYVLINCKEYQLDPSLVFTDVVITKTPDVAAIPAQPEILSVSTYYASVNIPLTDEEGNDIQASNLSYQYYYDINGTVTPLTLTTELYPTLDEDMTEIPYLFTDNWDIDHFGLYLNMDISKWHKMGIQSIYRGGGEENRSEIFWYDIKPYSSPITFTAANDFTIQNGQATVSVDGEDVTALVEADGTLVAADKGNTVTIEAAENYRFVNVTATTQDYVAPGVTVFDGTATNSYVPVYGLYTDAYLKSEFVVPAEALAGMNGQDVNAMTFYLASSASAAWTANFQVFLKEVPTTTLADFTGLTDATVVYEGQLDATGETMDVKFDTPYNYQGGNLLVGVYCTEPGNNFKSASFYGETVEGASVQGYSYSSLDDVTATQRNFIPKTTFSWGTAEFIDIDLDVTIAEDGSKASFKMVGTPVTVNYELQKGYSLTVPAESYATFYVDEKVTLATQGCQLLTVTAVGDETVTVTEITVADANTPMLVYNPNAEDMEVYLVPTENDADEVAVAPEFKGTSVEKTFTEEDLAAADHYVLTGKNFVFAPHTGTIAANRCWLELAKGEPQNARSIEFGDGTTSIGAVSAQTDNHNVWYDLNGRKLQGTPTTKGVYIVNGKKHVIK